MNNNDIYFIRDDNKKLIKIDGANWKKVYNYNSKIEEPCALKIGRKFVLVVPKGWTKLKENYAK